MSRPVIVIGISGPSNSGKTTLTQRLVNELPTSVSICQDHYFLAPGDPRLEPLYVPSVDHHNWEDYLALEMDQMVADVDKKIAELKSDSKATPAVLIVEGFSILGYKDLCSKLDRKYLIQVAEEVCQERRLSRNYDPPDVPGYFSQVVWPMHKKYLELIEDQKDIVQMDCNKSIDTMHERIIQDLKNCGVNTEVLASRQLSSVRNS